MFVVDFVVAFVVVGVVVFVVVVNVVVIFKYFHTTGKNDQDKSRHEYRARRAIGEKMVEIQANSYEGGDVDTGNQCIGNIW